MCRLTRITVLKNLYPCVQTAFEKISRPSEHIDCVFIMKFPQTWATRLAHKIRQTKRLSKKSIALLFLLAGSALVALTALMFAYLADLAFGMERFAGGKISVVRMGGFAAGLPLLAWFTRKFAPYTSGSGIPQVIASLSLPYGAQKTRLIRLGETF